MLVSSVSVAKAKAKSKSWEAEEYLRQMGADALARQQTQTAKTLKRDTCDCAQRGTSRSEEVGPYHRISCPLYAPESATSM